MWIYVFLKIISDLNAEIYIVTTHIIKLTTLPSQKIHVSVNIDAYIFFFFFSGVGQLSVVHFSTLGTLAGTLKQDYCKKTERMKL